MLCSICHRQEAKYKCPACGTKTCSLECVKRHKKQAECSGAVDSTRFVSRDELQADLVHLNRDYNFLNRVGRDLQVMRNDIQTDKKHINKRALQGSSGPQVKRFQNQAAMNADPRAQCAKRLYNDAPMINKRQNTLVISVPAVLERSRNNKSGYDKKEGQFRWTVECVFLDKEGEEIRRISNRRCGELMQLIDIVPAQTLQEFKENTPKEDFQLEFYLHDVLNKSLTTYIQLEPELNLADALKDKVVLEYPTIFISFLGSALKGEISLCETAYSSVLKNENNKDADSSSDSDEDDSSSSESDDNSEADSSSESDFDEEEAVNNTGRLNKIENGTQKNNKDRIATDINKYPDSDSEPDTDSDDAPQESLSKIPVV